MTASTPSKQPDASRRVRLFLLAIGAFLGLGAGIVAIALSAGAQARPPDDPAAIAAVRANPHVFLRRTAPADVSGRVIVVPMAEQAGTGALTDLSCERFYFAAGRGICLAARPGLFATYRALLLDSELAVVGERELAGIPSRARVSPDGRYAAMTVFVSGHSYAGAGFSTQTHIVDAATAELVADLEDFTVTQDGVPITAADMNFWGVTFTADSNVFYATLGTGGQRWLVRGDIAQRQFELLVANVECPSLSPDGTKIAFKRRIRDLEAFALTGKPDVWRLHYLKLDDMGVVIPIGTELRDVDDQVEWFDNDSVIYAVEDLQARTTSLWRTQIDGGAPELFAATAESPAVVSPSSVGVAP
jgi:hypothetical protein